MHKSHTPASITGLAVDCDRVTDSKEADFPLSLAQFPRFVRSSAAQLSASTPHANADEVASACTDYLNSRIGRPIEPGNSEGGFTHHFREIFDGVRVERQVPVIAKAVSPGERIMSERTIANLDMRIFFKRCFDFEMPMLVRQIVEQSLLHPPRSVTVAQARQDAVREISENSALRESVRNLTSVLRQFEQNMPTWDNCLRYGSDPYTSYQLMNEGLPALTQAVKDMPESGSPYLKILQERVLALEDTTNFRYVTQGIEKKNTGIAVLDVERDSGAKRKFYPFPMSEVQQTLIGCIAGLSAFAGASTFLVGWEGAATVLGGLAGGLLTTFIGAFYRTNSDNTGVIQPMLRQLFREPRFWIALEAAGRMGELLAYAELTQSHHGAIFPKLIRGSNHCFNVRGMICPSERNNAGFVPVDVEILDNSVTFITGPNSAGKTRTGKTISYTQSLAQNGGPVFCQSAEIGVADEIVYQSRTFETIVDKGGDLETSLGETAGIIMSASPHSLLLIDEPAKGTSSTESNRITRDRIVTPLLVIGSSAVIISHKFEVAQELAAEQVPGVGYFQLEVIGDRATHRIIPGIARSSLANQVADDAGLSLTALVTRLKQISAQGELPSQ